MKTIVQNTSNRIYFQTLDPVQSGITVDAEIFDDAGSLVLSMPATESGTLGVYYADITLPTPGNYIIRFISASLTEVCYEHIKVVLEDSDMLSLLTQILSIVGEIKITTDNVEVCTDLIKKGLYNRMKIDENTNELILYDDDSTTELLRFGLKDIDGLPTSTKIFEMLKGVV